jgi:hypothetical protein
MVSVEQIRALEERIERALAYIASLRAENAALKTKLEAARAESLRAEERADSAGMRVLELEEAAATFRQDQARIEEGIIHALEKLDAFEDLVLHADGAEDLSLPTKVAPSPASPRAASAKPRQAVQVISIEEPVTIAPSAESEPASITDIEGPTGVEGAIDSGTADRSAIPETRQSAVDELDIF